MVIFDTCHVRWVLDTSALFQLEDFPEGEIYVPPGVLEELDRYGDTRTPFLSGLLSVVSPGGQSLAQVIKAASETGDDARLSPVDLEILALAIELKAVVMSDDYSIQNLASHMGIEYFPLGQEGIRRKLRWRYKCTGCGRVWKDMHIECPICGASLRSVRSR